MKNINMFVELENKMEEKKYELTEETIHVPSCTLHRIKALKDFSDVHKGDLGGFIEKEDNLSQDGNCWIFNDAKVFDNAIVYDDALIGDGANVYDNAIICGEAQVFDYAKIYGNAKVYENAQLYRSAKVYGNARVFGNAEVYNYGEIFDDARIYGKAVVCDNAQVYGKAVVCGNAYVCEDAKICGDVIVCGDAEIFGNAVIQSFDDYEVFQNKWSSGRCFTWTKSNNMWKVGCFYGTGKELIKKAYENSKESGRKYKAYVNLVKKLNTPKESFREKIMKLFKKR